MADRAYSGPVFAEFHQYYLQDTSTSVDWVAADTLNDGILSPLASGVRVSTGIQVGEVSVRLTVLPTPEYVLPATDAPFAECSLVLPSGAIALLSYPSDAAWLYDFGAPSICRVRVQVLGRDTLTGPGGNGSNERHELHIWTERATRPRLEPASLDAVGVALREVRA